MLGDLVRSKRKEIAPPSPIEQFLSSINGASSTKQLQRETERLAALAEAEVKTVRSLHEAVLTRETCRRSTAVGGEAQVAFERRRAALEEAEEEIRVKGILRNVARARGIPVERLSMVLAEELQRTQSPPQEWELDNLNDSVNDSVKEKSYGR